MPYAEFDHPVAFFMNGIGDTILALPTLRAISQIFAGKLTLICERGMYDILLSDLSPVQLIEVRSYFDAVRCSRSFASHEVADIVAQCDLFITVSTWSSELLEAL